MQTITPFSTGRSVYGGEPTMSSRLKQCFMQLSNPCAGPYFRQRAAGGLYMVVTPTMSSCFKHRFPKLSDHFDRAAFLCGEQLHEPSQFEQRALSVARFLGAIASKGKRFLTTSSVFFRKQPRYRRNQAFFSGNQLDRHAYNKPKKARHVALYI